MTEAASPWLQIGEKGDLVKKVGKYDLRHPTFLVARTGFHGRPIDGPV